MVKGTFERRLRARLLRLARSGVVPHAVVAVLARNMAYHDRASERPSLRLTQHRDEMERLRLAIDGLLPELGGKSLAVHARGGVCSVPAERIDALASELRTLRAWADREHDDAASTVRGLAVSGRLARLPKSRDRNELLVYALIEMDELGLAIVGPSRKARGGRGIARQAVDVVEAILGASRWGAPADEDGSRRYLRDLVAQAWKRAEPIIRRHEQAENTRRN